MGEEKFEIEWSEEFEVPLEEEGDIYERVVDLVQEKGLEWLFDWEDSVVTYSAYPRQQIRWDALGYRNGFCYAIQVWQTKDFSNEKIFVKVEVAPVDAIDPREFELSWLPYFRNYVEDWVPIVKKIAKTYNLKIQL